MVALVVLAMSLTGLSAHYLLVKDMRLATERNLASLLAARRGAFTTFLDEIQSDMRIYRESAGISTAISQFSRSWHDIEDSPTATLQNLYIENNPFPTGEKERLDDARDGSSYSEVHAKYHLNALTILMAKGYHDIFLFDADGNLLYTALKERDFATNILSGPWNTTGLSEVYRAAMEKSASDPPAFVDFQSYVPSGSAPASFMAAPIFGAKGELLGALALQMPVDRMNGFMHVTEGLGETGETYLVGQDLLMRSDSRFSEVSTILRTKVDTAMARNALNGESGIVVGPDYRGVHVLSAYAPVSFLGTHWGLLAEIDETEILKPVGELTARLIEGGILIMTIAAFISYLVAARLSRPIVKINETMARLAEGDLDIEIPLASRNDEIGDMQQALAVFKDNAVVRRNIARELESNRKLLTAVIDDAADGIATANASGTILSFNTTAEKMFGWGAEEVIGQNISILMEGENGRDHEQYVQKYLSTGESKMIGIGREVIGRRRDESEFPLYLAVSDSTVDGERLFTGIMRDLTEIKVAEQKIRNQRDELKKLNLQKSRFFSIIAHDLKGPISAVTGLSEILAEGIDELEKQQVAKFCQALNQSNKQVLGLLTNLLDWSMSQLDEIKFEPEPTDSENLIRNSVAVLEGMIRDKEIAFEIQAEGGSVLADPNMISTVLRNLVSNAIKFTPRGNQITVSSKIRGARVEFAITDTGIGIRPEKTAELFELRSGAPSSGTEGEPGTGLGLTLCKELVERHGGEINVKSEIGLGSTFTFTLLHLPMEEADEEPGNEARTSIGAMLGCL